MKKNVIVSLADSNYFPLLLELVESIQRFKGEAFYETTLTEPKYMIKTALSI